MNRAEDKDNLGELAMKTEDKIQLQTMFKNTAARRTMPKTMSQGALALEAMVRKKVPKPEEFPEEL